MSACRCDRDTLHLQLFDKNRGHGSTKNVCIATMQRNARGGSECTVFSFFLFVSERDLSLSEVLGLSGFFSQGPVRKIAEGLRRAISTLGALRRAAEMTPEALGIHRSQGRVQVQSRPDQNGSLPW